MFDLLDQPGHILPEIPHGLDPFLILGRFARLSADPDIPVGRADHDHLADQEKIVERAEDVRGPGPSHRHNAGIPGTPYLIIS